MGGGEASLMQMYCPEGKHEVPVRSMNQVRGERFCPEHGCEMRQVRKQRGAPALPSEKAASAHFCRVVCSKPCFFLDRTEFGERRRPGHTCRFPLDPHHLIPQDFLKRELDLPPDELVAVMYEPIIGAPLCRKAHDAVEYQPDEHIYRDELNPDLILFCERFDAQHPGQRSLLERLYLECPEREVAG
jgi:hypothetical protein